MKLRVLLPTEILLEKEVVKIIAEAGNGLFCLLPSHIDFVAALVPGILSFETESGEEIFLAVDEGVLVKNGQEVMVSTLEAVQGKELGSLRRTVEEKYQVMDESERSTRSAMAKIEAGFVRRFLEIQKRG